MPKILLIGGAPTVGKTYAAKQLASDLKVACISTDRIREDLKQSVSERVEEFPALFYHSSFTATEFLTQHTVSEIVVSQNIENAEVWKAILPIISIDQGSPYIIEGVAILPELVAQLMDTNKEVSAVFLINEDEEHIRKTIFTRGLWDDAEKYPDSVKEIEVRWVVAFNRWIMKEAVKHNLPLILTDKKQDFAKRAICDIILHGRRA